MHQTEMQKILLLANSCAHRAMTANINAELTGAVAYLGLTPAPSSLKPHDVFAVCSFMVTHTNNLWYISLCSCNEAPLLELNRLTPIKCRKEVIKGVGVVLQFYSEDRVIGWTYSALCWFKELQDSRTGDKVTAELEG